VKLAAVNVFGPGLLRFKHLIAFRTRMTIIDAISFEQVHEFTVRRNILRIRLNLVLFVLFVILLPVGLGLSASAHQAQGSKDADAAIKKGDDLYKAGKYIEAIEAYKQALVSDPNNDHALNYIGVAYSKVGDRAAAREAMKRRLDIPGQTPSIKARTLQDIAVLCWDESDLRLARQWALGADKAKPEETQLIAKLVAEGADSAQKAIAIAPKSAKAFSLLNLLDRTAASMEQDPAKQKELIGKADEALRQSIQFYDASPQQQQSNDLFAAPMISAASAASDTSIKLGDATKKVVPDSLKNVKGISVAVEVFIGRDGKVSLSRPVSSSGNLGDAALEAVRHWEFQPTSFDGHAVQTVELVTFPEKK
jgi:hypothetical protein